MWRRVAIGALAMMTTLPFTGCGPLGLKPTVPLRPLPPPPLTRRADAPDRPAGYYRFTESEWRQLDRTPCIFNPAKKRAARLYRRGFSKAEILQACRDVKTYADGDQRYLEHLAVWRRSGLSLAGFKDFMGSGRTITDHYNREILGGQNLAVGGWILTSIGLALFTGAAATMIAYRVREARCLDRNRGVELPCDHDGGAFWGAWIASIFQAGFGALFVAPGLPMGIVGQLRKNRWLGGELLDRGHVRDLDRFRLRYLDGSRRRTVHASVAPLVTRGGGGLTLRLQW